MPIEIIQKINPLEYKNDIINMWKTNLPGTPGDRFDWISSGNPFGKAIWFLAIEEKNRKLIGTTNISPKNNRDCLQISVCQSVNKDNFLLKRSWIIPPAACLFL